MWTWYFYHVQLQLHKQFWTFHQIVKCVNCSEIVDHQDFLSKFIRCNAYQPKDNALFPQVVPYAISEIHLIPTCHNSLELSVKFLKEGQNCGLILLGGNFLIRHGVGAYFESWGNFWTSSCHPNFLERILGSEIGYANGTCHLRSRIDLSYVGLAWLTHSCKTTWFLIA